MREQSAQTDTTAAKCVRQSSKVRIREGEWQIMFTRGKAFMHEVMHEHKRLRSEGER